MQFALGAVTLISLTMVGVMAIVTWRLVREERRRSAARLALLAAELDRHRPRTSAADDAAPGPTQTPLFEPGLTSPGLRSRRAAGIAVAGLLVLALVSGVLLTGSRAGEPERSDHPPVELLALTHEQDETALTISGRVRHPSRAADDRPLTVVATVFDDAGALVASARSDLVGTARSAGSSTPFVIAVPAGQAHRYRISFLAGDAPVPHIDRRSGTPPPATEADEVTTGPPVTAHAPLGPGRHPS